MIILLSFITLLTAIMTRLLMLVVLLLASTENATASDNQQAQEVRSDSASSSEGKDYRHNIKMLTGVEDVRKATLFKASDFSEEPELN